MLEASVADVGQLLRLAVTLGTMVLAGFAVLETLYLLTWITFLTLHEKRHSPTRQA